ncbi:hypothetical protein HHI36_013146 [Cryptolaemus montrouzieri]|uniref:Retrotransposon gag domain-containing protein n=1 Tax=Cryptolaemus montrouzieri TaxID=559131 RepID=A0ABD2NGY1_9CUCU
MSPRANFHFLADALDAKTTVVRVLTIQLEGEDTVFQFPREQQLKEHHPVLFGTTIVKNVIKGLKIRGKFRNIRITLADELQQEYLDKEGNVCFHDQYLDEVQGYVNPNPTAPQISRTNLDTNKPIHSVVKDLILEKFNGKNQNAKTFLSILAKECERLNIESSRYSEVLRLFVEGPALDWYLTFLKINSFSYEWEFWQNSFLDTFSEVGWTEINYAYTFRYLNGSLLDYALKKLNLLIDADPELTANSQMNFFVLGLPTDVRLRINKCDLLSRDALMSRIRQLEPLVVNNDKKMNSSRNDRFNAVRNSERVENTSGGELKYKKLNRQVLKPCSHCAVKGFPNRFHPENTCRNFINNTKRNYKNDIIKSVNNTELEDSISSSDEAKNE